MSISGLACFRWWSTDRKRSLFYMALYWVVAGSFAYWSIAVHGALQSDTYLVGHFTSQPTLGIVLRNIQFQLSETGSPLVFGWLPLLSLALPLFNPASRQHYYIDYPLWMFPAFLVCYDIIISFEGAPVFERQYLAANTVQSIMAGIGVVLLFQSTQELFTKIWTDKKSAAGHMIIFAVVTVGLGIPLAGSWIYALDSIYKNNQEDLLPDRRAILAQWASTTATDGPLIVTETNQASALQTLYGYHGPQLEMPFNFDTSIVPRDVDISQQMIDAAHIRYLITQPEFFPKKLSAPVTRLITYGGDDLSYRGDAWAAFYVGRLPPLLPTAQAITFGQQIVLRGLGVSTQTVCSGAMVTLRTLWSSLQQPLLDYSFYVHLYNTLTGEQNANINGNPLAIPTRPTSSWSHPDELLVGASLQLELPIRLAAGKYELWLGVFEPVGGNRLRTAGGQDHSVVGSVNVRNCPTNLFF